MLLPDASRRSRIDLYRSVVTDEAGRFQLPFIPPGDYKLFVWEDVEKGAWQNLDFMRAYEERGKAIRLGDGSKQTIEATPVPRDR